MDALGYIEEAADGVASINEDDTNGVRVHLHLSDLGVHVTARLFSDEGEGLSEAHRAVAFQTIRSALVNPIRLQIGACLRELGVPDHG